MTIMHLLPGKFVLILAVLAAMGHSCLSADKEEREVRTDLQKQVSAEIDRIRRSKMPSVSKGQLTNGILEHPAELRAPEGVGYYLAHPTRDTNFGHDRLVFGLMSMGVHLREQLGNHADHRLRIHDLSTKFGGKQERHINHQMGLDVDLAFYATDLKGNVTSSKWTSYDVDGKAADGHRLFDVGRNWEIVVGILSNEYFGDIRSILIADHLKKKLLTHAHKQLRDLALEDDAERAKLEALIQKAEVLMRQPKSSPHDNHFHLSLSNTDQP